MGIVILSGVRSSRSELRTEPKDPYSAKYSRDRGKEFSRACVSEIPFGAVSESKAIGIVRLWFCPGKAGAESSLRMTELSK